jgi:hypothetical protein
LTKSTYAIHQNGHVSSVQEAETYSGIFDGYLNWLDYGINGDLPKRDSLSINFRLGPNSLIPASFTQTGGTTQKYV